MKKLTEKKNLKVLLFFSPFLKQPVGNVFQPIVMPSKNDIEGHLGNNSQNYLEIRNAKLTWSEADSEERFFWNRTNKEPFLWHYCKIWPVVLEKNIWRDRRRTVSGPKRTPWAFGSGELKTWKEFFPSRASKKKIVAIWERVKYNER